MRVEFITTSDTSCILRFYINGQFASEYVDSSTNFKFYSEYVYLGNPNSRFGTGIGRDYFDTGESFTGNLGSAKVFKGPLGREGVFKEYRSAFNDYEGQLNWLQLPSGNASEVYWPRYMFAG